MKLASRRRSMAGAEGRGAWDGRCSARVLSQSGCAFGWVAGRWVEYVLASQTPRVMQPEPKKLFVLYLISSPPLPRQALRVETLSSPTRHYYFSHTQSANACTLHPSKTITSCGFRLRFHRSASGFADGNENPRRRPPPPPGSCCRCRFCCCCGLPPAPSSAAFFLLPPPPPLPPPGPFCLCIIYC